MPLDFDPAGDLLYFDDLRTVSLVKVAPAGTLTTYEGISAIRMAVNRRANEAGPVQIIPATTTWHLEASTLPSGVTPARSDRLVNGSDTWVLESALLDTLTARWECDAVLKVSA